MQATEDSSTDSPMPPMELMKSLQEKMGEISMLPSVASEAIALTNDPECTAVQFGEVVRRDVSLATEMLTLANSSMFSNGKQVSKLEQVIVRLGFQQCRNWIISSSAASLMKKMALEEQWIREVLWKHSVATAATCSLLNRTFKLGFDGEEFTAGLLHDFGRLLLFVASEDSFPKADPLDFSNEDGVLEKERSVLGTDHCCFGAWFAKNSGLPLCLIEAIRWHHEDNPACENSRLVTLVAAADHVANYIQSEKSIQGYSPESNPKLVTLCESINSNLSEQFSVVETTLMEEISASLS